MSSKYSFLALIIVSTTFSSCSKYNEWKRHGLVGKVESYVEKTYEAENKFGEWQKSNLIDSGYHKMMFSDDGLVNNIDYFDINDNLTFRIIPTYENEKIIESKHYDGDGEYILTYKATHITSNLREYLIIDASEDTLRFIKEHYKNNRLVKFEDSQDSDFTSVTVYYYEYDENNFLKSMRMVNDNKPVYHIVYEYIDLDEVGNWLVREQYRYNNDEDQKDFEYLTIRYIKYY